MFHQVVPIVSNREAAPGIFVLAFKAPAIAGSALAGQFVNIKVNEENAGPLLRRPLSIYNINGDEVSVLFNIRGSGTAILSGKKAGDRIDIIGPLGNSFTVDDGFETAILAGGGVGVASLPLLTAALKKNRKQIITYLGARTSDGLVPEFLENVRFATDDGSRGNRGTVVGLLNSELRNGQILKSKIFACGPPAMLQTLSDLALEMNIPCEVSVESVMACGIGLCQGCPIELVNQEAKYALVCKDGPIFDSRIVRIVLHV